jgi:hypothetical protein
MGAFSAPYPTFVASDPHLNGKGSVAFSSVANTTTIFISGDTPLNQPGTCVFVYYYDGSQGGGWGLVDGSGGTRWLYRPLQGTNHALYCGTTVTGGAGITAAGSYFSVVNVNGASSNYIVNNSAPVAFSGSPGAAQLGGPYIPSQTNISTAGLSGAIAFVGYKGNGLLSAGDLTNLQNWASAYYGLGY